MFEGKRPAQEKERIAETGEADCGLIVAFVVSTLLGLAGLGWYYHAFDKTAPVCASAEAHCGEQSGAVVQ